MRKIQAPGVEINEFDRSQYGEKVDNSLPNAPVVLIAGFADIGEDYTIQWVNSQTTLNKYYGYPTNEAERYFYNACLEVLNRGGYCVTAKLPYYNKSKDKYSYTTYEIDKSSKNVINSVIDWLKKENVVQNHECREETQNIKHSLYDFIFNPDDLIFSYLVGINPSTNKRYSLKKDGTAIDLSVCQNVVEYVDEQCDFEYETKRTFNALFYDSTDLRNYSSRLLSTIYDNSSISSICSAWTDESSFIFPMISAYSAQISSMHNTMHSVENITSFGDFIQNFASTKSFQYYKDYIQSISSQIDDVVDEDCKDILSGYLKCCVDVDGYLSVNSFDYSSVRLIDPSIKQYYKISSSSLSNSTKMSFDDFDGFKTGLLKPKQGQFYIVDTARQTYDEVDVISGYGTTNQKTFKDKDVLGIVPIVTTPMNALYFQQIIDSSTENISAFNVVSQLRTCYTDDKTQFIIGENGVQLENVNLATSLSSIDIDDPSISQTASKMFPTIAINNDNAFDREYLKQIGVVVLKAYKDVANNSKINFQVVESFVGSLDKNATDQNTHENIYIGNRINNNSQYINFFSNAGVDDKNDNFDTYCTANQIATSLGFYESECEKDISYSESIAKPLTTILQHAQNSYSLPLDIVLDAGVSNIAQFIRTIYWKEGYGKYDFNLPDNISALKNVTASNSSAWKAILQKFDDFCKNSRMNKDCMFIADGLRHFCLIGNEKKIRRSCHTSNFIDDIYPGLKFMTALDSSYSAGYCNWVYAPDAYSTDMFWMPPSIKAASSYIYTDTYFHKWDAPAGLNRGLMNNVYDVAFNPTIDEAGKLYNQQWNYAVSYPIDGIVIEGQKTFQKNKTALDRVNVRRLMLYLEKEVVRIGLHYLYEGNTEYLRERFVDALEVVFDDCQDKNGIVEYAIKCDDENNTEETIENNELHVKIGVKPVKTLEFLVCDFIVTKQSSSVTEEIISE